MSEIISSETLPQGSPEWLLWRKKGIGSSDIAVILGVSPYKTPYTLWLEKTGQQLEEDLSGNFAVQRGIALESEARDGFNKLKNANYKPVLFISSEHEFMRFSCDGFDRESNTFIEIKCPGEESHNKALAGVVPEHYMMQVQFGLLVSAASKALYVSYNPNHDFSYAVVEVKPDIKTITKIITESVNFWNGVLSLTPPKLTNKDLIEIIDPEIYSVAEAYRNTKAAIEQKELELKELETKIKEYAKKNSISYGSCNGITVQKIIKQGNVDYSKIESIKGINLDPYRKPATEYYKINVK
jgi:putative phage-type endonuclease